ncbi:SdpI family protein [Corynebacterium afermentans]|uniref:SdpI family protein n=1 Tax=Corynebacterium afermentans TaxID=38286 RepID=UPI00336A2191
MLVTIRSALRRFDSGGDLQVGSALAISALALLFFGVNSLILWRKTLNGTNSRNDGFGIRTQATRTSDEAWNAGHRAAAPLLRTFGVLDSLRPTPRRNWPPCT